MKHIDKANYFIDIENLFFKEFNNYKQFKEDIQTGKSNAEYVEFYKYFFTNLYNNVTNFFESGKNF